MFHGTHQVSELQEKLKVETENCQRLRKQAAELTMAKSASEQMAGEFQTMLQTLQLQRDSLQSEVASLQGQLTQEKSSRTQASDQQQVLETKIQSLNGELDQSRQRESKVNKTDKTRDTRRLGKKILILFRWQPIICSWWSGYRR